jgi:hypothetical protein
MSRLDTVIVLLHPIVIAGITALVELQYSSLIKIEVFGFGLVILIVSLGLFFTCGIVLGFVEYILSYLANDVARRVRSCRKLVWGSLGMAFQLTAIPTVPLFQYVGAHFSVDVLSAFGLFWMYVTFVYVDAWRGLVSKSSEKITRWIEENARNCLEGTGLSSSKFALEAKLRFSRIKRDMLWGCIVGTMPVIVAWFQGVREVSFLSLELILAAFIMVTIAIWWLSRR